MFTCILQSVKCSCQIDHGCPDLQSDVVEKVLVEKLIFWLLHTVLAFNNCQVWGGALLDMSNAFEPA